MRHTLANAYRYGYASALEKLGLGPPTQVDQFVADVENGKDIPPSTPPMAGMPGMAELQCPPALDGTTPLEIPSGSPPTPPGLGSTIGQMPLAGDPGMPPPTVGG